MFDLTRALQTPELVYLQKDGDTNIQVLRNDQYQWLQLDDTVHTLMDINQPQRLVLPHLHAMSMALHLHPGPVGSALELGLGGGALSRFLVGQCHCQVTSIELSAPIIHCFKQFFNPEALDFDIVQADVRDEIGLHRGKDLLFVDLFGGQRLPEFLNDQAFYQQCFAALTQQGILVLNLLPDSQLYLYEVEQILQGLTGVKPLCLSIPGYKNRLLFCSKTPLPALEYDQALIDFSQQYQIDLNLFVQL